MNQKRTLKENGNKFPNFFHNEEKFCDHFKYIRKKSQNIFWMENVDHIGNCSWFSCIYRLSRFF